MTDSNPFISKETVARVAKLARLHVPDADQEALLREFDSILKFIAQLNEVNTTDVPPLTSVVETRLAMRPDAVTDGGQPEKVLANAPQQAVGFFVVPKVVE